MKSSNAADAGGAAAEGDRCANCNSACARPKRCSICKAAAYCSQKCQKEDWRFHKRNCKKPPEKEKEEGPRPLAVCQSSEAPTALDLAVCSGDASTARALAENGVPLHLLKLTDLLCLEDDNWPCHAEHTNRNHKWACIKDHVSFQVDRIKACLAAAAISAHIAEAVRRMCVSAQTLQLAFPMQSWGLIEASLSLLDVAILVGDDAVTAKLALMGVPQLFRFGVTDFIVEGSQLYPNSQSPEPLMTEKGALRVEAAFAAGLDWRALAPRGSRSEWAWMEYGEGSNHPSTSWDARRLCHGILLDGAILGQQVELAARLSKAGFVSPSLTDLGTSILRLRATRVSELPEESRMRVTMQVYLDKGMIDAAVAAGIVRELRISPVYVFHQGFLQHMVWPLPPDSFWDHPRFNPNQSPLAMAISLGDAELAKSLVRQGCQHMALTSEFLSSDFPSTETFYLQVASCDTLLAARAAYSCASRLYQVLLLQWAQWWYRKEHDGLQVMHTGVLNLIAIFALALPVLPELESSRQLSDAKPTCACLEKLNH